MGNTVVVAAQLLALMVSANTHTQDRSLNTNCVRSSTALYPAGRPGGAGGDLKCLLMARSRTLSSVKSSHDWVLLTTCLAIEIDYLVSKQTLSTIDDEKRRSNPSRDKT